MVEKADVVVENYRPDVKDRLGIDLRGPAQDQQAHRLASISGFGQDGPYRERPGFDQIAQGMGGLMSITGAPGQGPMRVGIPVADLSAGLFAALGILVALLEREVSGEGQWVTTSLLQAQIFMLDFQAARWLQMQRGGQAGRQQSPDLDPDRRVQDQGRLHQHRRGRAGDVGAALCEAIGAPELIERPDYKSNDAALEESRRASTPKSKSTRSTKTSAEWIDIFNKAGVPSGPIYTIDQVFADPQVKHLGIAQDGTKPDGETQTFVGQPVTLSRTPSKIVATPPAQGQHTDEVLKEFGFADDEIAALHTAKAV